MKGRDEMGLEGRRYWFSSVLEGALPILRHDGLLGRHTDLRYSPSDMWKSRASRNWLFTRLMILGVESF